MIINGVYLLLIVGAWVAYRVAVCIGEPTRESATDRENGSE